MGQRLEGKVALITGAARGMGAAEATRFADEGARIAVADILDTAEVVSELGEQALGVQLDVADPAQWAAAVTATIEQFGRLDILINNAGVAFAARPLGEEDQGQHEKIWAVNADGVYHGIRAVSPTMKAQGSGSIINISSIDGLIGVAGMMSYTASKFAVTGMTRVAALELGAHGIRVNSIHPGVIATPLLDSAPPLAKERLQRILDQQAIPRAGTVEEVAYLALYLASDESTYCTGAQFVIDGGHLAGPYREGYDAASLFGS